MAFEIGNPNHKTFPLAEKTGQVTKLLSLPKAGKRINVEKLTDFEFLAEGEERVMQDRCAIEVADFAWHSHIATEDHHITSQHLEVDAGSVLSGPIAWRAKGAVSQPRRALPHLPRFLLTALAGICLVPIIAEIYAMYQQELPFDIQTVGTSNMHLLTPAILLLTGEILNSAHKELKASLAADPVATVRAPAKRLWA